MKQRTAIKDLWRLVPELHVYRMYCLAYSRIKNKKKHNKIYKNIDIEFDIIDFYKFVRKDWDKYKKMHTEWVNSGNSKKLTPTIDRINSKGNYNLKNIRIVTHSDNSKNVKRQLYLFEGKKMNLHQISEKMNVKYRTLYARVKIYKIPPEIAFLKGDHRKK